MLQVRCNHFPQRIDHDSLHCIDNIFENARIVERFACPIVARIRGPREPLALAALAVLRNSLRELAVGEDEPRHHRVVSGVNDSFFYR
jgi:hypothetical protein